MSDHWVHSTNCDFQGNGTKCLLQVLDYGKRRYTWQGAVHMLQGQSYILLNPTSHYQAWGSWDCWLRRAQSQARLLLVEVGTEESSICSCSICS